MKLVQAQFSLKFEPLVQIRRNANEIEDFLKELYGVPQTFPIPDNFAADAARILLHSKGGHSQISFSQISVDFIVNFDDDFTTNFNLTKNYLIERLNIIKNLLNRIGINTFCYAGISYDVKLDTDSLSPVDYMKKKLQEDDEKLNELYEMSRRVSHVKNNKYFVNESIGSYRQYQGSSVTPLLMNIGNSEMVDEGVNLSLDVNSRYEYLTTGNVSKLDEYDSIINDLYSITEKELDKWK